MEQFSHRLNQAPDVRAPFLDPDHFLFVADKALEFDAKTGKGRLAWARHRRKSRIAFEHMSWPLEAVESWEFPSVYPEPKDLPFQISFISDRTIRLRWRSRPGEILEKESLMLAGSVPSGAAWKAVEEKGQVVYKGTHGALRLRLDPWGLDLEDAQGRTLTHTQHPKDSRCMIGSRPVPFCFVRTAGELEQSIAASFRLNPGEKIFGCGESFTRLDKRGQTVRLWTQDPHGSLTGEMYKPVPFFMSDRGYGVFIHESTPMALDFGDSYDEAQVLYTGSESLDLFLFLGGPKEILAEYTALTGRSPRPPLWSFGLWMSRITYDSEKQARNIGSKLREHKIPCDVIHLDTGWFEHDWRCDYQFSKTRFPEPVKMIKDLGGQGFHVCLWQLPYFSPPNPLFPEIVKEGLVVKGPGGELPGEDAVLDFSNPKTVSWYQEKLEGLLKQGVGAIKVDFGEGAPLNGLYASGKTGWFEHNLYPLRYNKAAADVSRTVTGHDLIWARSAWAGSQRFPLHWGGDAESNDGAMLGTLRGGLSFGLCGFSYWSHDIGGFSPATPQALYRRWLPFGLLSSHSRCHGQPPTEPWEFDAEFLELFRKTTEFRYSLLPYIWAQATICSQKGLPMLRPLFLEFPQDPGSWLVEDAYLLGSDILVAPLFEEVNRRKVYLPSGAWVDMQRGTRHEGGRWQDLEVGAIPALILAREGSLIPRCDSAPHTGAQDWSKIRLEVWGKPEKATGFFTAKDAKDCWILEAVKAGNSWKLAKDPSAGKVSWDIKQTGA